MTEIFSYDELGQIIRLAERALGPQRVGATEIARFKRFLHRNRNMTWFEIIPGEFDGYEQVHESVREHT